MVATTVVLAAIIAIFATGISGNLTETANAGVTMDQTSEGVEVTVNSLGNVESLHVLVNGTEIDGSELTSVGGSVIVTSPEDATVTVIGETSSGEKSSIKSVTSDEDTTGGEDPKVISTGGGSDDGTASMSDPNSTAPNCSEITYEESGTTSDPYKISNDHELQCISKHKDSHFVLTQNIDASETTNWNSGKGFTPIGSSDDFSGSLNGAGYEITGLTIERKNGSYVGLFADIDGSVSNVGLVNVSITNDVDDMYVHYTGGIAANNSGDISNSYVTGSVSGGISGGIVSENHSGASVTNSYAAASVSGRGGAGGITGNNDGEISSSYWDKTKGPDSATSHNDGTMSNVSGLTTSEMQGSSASSNMSALDFDSTWTTIDGDYPELQ